MRKKIRENEVLSGGFPRTKQLQTNFLIMRCNLENTTYTYVFIRFDYYLHNTNECWFTYIHYQLSSYTLSLNVLDCILLSCSSSWIGIYAACSLEGQLAKGRLIERLFDRPTRRRPNMKRSLHWRRMIIPFLSRHTPRNAIPIDMYHALHYTPRMLCAIYAVLMEVIINFKDNYK